MSPQSAFDASSILANTPACLRERRQWVAWRYVEREGKATKVPVNPRTGGSADSTDPTTWGTFQEAVQVCQQDAGLAGIGFVFSPDDPYCGVDLDDCVDAGSGALSPWAVDIIARLASYTETSPSGTGVKVFLRANKPGRRCRKAYEGGEVEIYDRDRFFTVTGRRLPQSPVEIQLRQEPLERIYRTVFGSDEGPCTPRGSTGPSSHGSGNGHVQLDDDHIINLACGQRRSGAKFKMLWDGNWNAHFNSASEADSSVVFTLAFYTKDAAQIDRLFRRSGLMRPKWDEPHGAQTYGETTIEKALAKVTKQYKPRGKAHARPASPPPTQPGLPSIVIDDMQLSDLTDQALAAVLQGNTPPVVFVRAGALARVLCDENGMPKIEAFDRVRMRCRLAEVANFFTLRKGEGGCYEQVGTNPPLSLAENVLAQTTWRLPPLSGIARAPILRHDGTICTQPGYDGVSRLVYCPDPGLSLPPIPEYPDRNEVDACVDILLSVIQDFPFADAASRANALAILFSLLMRPVITGHVPLAIVDAPVQGTGKSLLATTLGVIAVGHIASESIPARNNEDEWRKKITSILLTASPLVLLDNIPDNTTIDSPTLAAVLTTGEWSDRLLGRNDTVQLPARVVWIATGNNLRVAGDIPRRSYCIRLDANEERPWQRTNFRIRDLEHHILEHRGDLLSAALTIIRAWYTHGKKTADVPTLGSFDGWASVVGSVLAFAGIDGFLGNLEQTQTYQDEETEQWTAFFAAWWDYFADGKVTVNDLARLMLPRKDDDLPSPPIWENLPEPLLVNRDRGEGSLRRSIGRNLSRLTGRIFEHRKLTDAGRDRLRNVRAWALKPTALEVSP